MLSAGMDISTVPEFSDPCSVQKLSQYLKRTCSFGREETTTTTNWLRIPAAEQVQKKSELSTSLMNKSTERELVMAFNDFQPLPVPELVAKEILLLANNKKPPSPAAAAAAAVKSSSPPPPAPNPIQQQTCHRQRKIEADILPMVRRVSLSRFLVKRKDRMMATAPYRG